ncbi:Meiosis specific protein SPO22 [Penicillium paradoxum]|uniref:Meiosis specific protein SPO22 n=1 Tax=Penicillium paradoxum TaxID=176176 RepID=UPI002547608D|nr:Meiosis specific protein SPO22 [Penicillium paradoxum]KAJ5780157.1 Meiosis specific protein SPO22 [Penicillium paradoxum]
MAQPLQSIKILTDIVTLLQTTISAPYASTGPLLSPDIILALDNNLNRNPFNSRNTPQGNSRLDNLGTLLWNTCTQVSLSRADNPDDSQTLAKVRAVAFAVLNKAVPADLLGSLRALDLALSAAQICLVNSQLDIALNILSCAAQRLANVQPSRLELDPAINRTLTTRYYLLRCRLAWLQRRPDLAELFFSKVPGPVLSKDRELIFELCFIIGDSALALRQSETALTWLQRASEHLQFLSISTEMTFPSFDSWNLIVRHSIAVACTQLKTPQAIAIRTSEMFILRELYPQQPGVILLDLSVGHNNGGISFERLLEGMILTESSMPVILQFARSLGQTGGLDDGIQAFRILLTRPLPSSEWREKCFVCFVLLLSRIRDSDTDSTHMSTLEDMLKELESSGYPSLSATAAQAAMICLWKMTGAAMLKQDYCTGQRWLLICTVPMIFRNCSSRIQITIQKKLIACYLHNGYIDNARTLMDRGLVQNPRDFQRMYLAYRLNMLEERDVSGFFRLGFPSDPIPKKQLSLLSCAMEAQRQHKPEQVLDCLEQFIKCLTSDDIYHHDFSAAEHYMFAITLLLEELSKGFNQRLGQHIETVLESTSSFVKETSVFEGGAQEVSVTQLQWLYFATYKIALKLSKSSGFQWTDPVLKYSKEFALQYRRIAYPETVSKAPRPHLFAVAYLSLLVSSLEARCEVDPAKKKSHYENVRTSFNELDDLFGWDDGEEESDHEVHVKEDRHHDIAQFFDLEAAMHLEQWEDVTKISESDDAFPKSKFHAPIMDLTLQLSLPPALAVKIIKRIVSKLGAAEATSGLPITSWQYNPRIALPRYLHCLFILAIAPRLDVQDVPGLAHLNVEMVDPEVAERVLDQVIAMGAAEAEVKSEEQSEQSSLGIPQRDSELYPFRGRFTYPTPELIKIATMAFNKACEFYRVTRDEECQRWANKAISVAQLVPGSEGEAMVRVLRNRLSSLISV